MTTPYFGVTIQFLFEQADGGSAGCLSVSRQVIRDITSADTGQSLFALTTMDAHHDRALSAPYVLD
jgi:hypothetical protein